jgi:hypothetical protein
MPPEVYRLDDTQLDILARGHAGLGLSDVRAIPYADIAKLPGYDEVAAQNMHDAAQGWEAGPFDFERAAATPVQPQPVHGLNFNTLTAA